MTDASRTPWNDVAHPQGMRSPLVGNHCLNTWPPLTHR